MTLRGPLIVIWLVYVSSEMVYSEVPLHAPPTRYYLAKKYFNLICLYRHLL